MIRAGVRLRSLLEERRGGFREGGDGQPRAGLLHFVGGGLGRDREGAQAARGDPGGAGLAVLLAERREAHRAHDESQESVSPTGAWLRGPVRSCVSINERLLSFICNEMRIYRSMMMMMMMMIDATAGQGDAGPVRESQPSVRREESEEEEENGCQEGNDESGLERSDVV